MLHIRALPLSTILLHYIIKLMLDGLGRPYRASAMWTRIKKKACADGLGGSTTFVKGAGVDGRRRLPRTFIGMQAAPLPKKYAILFCFAQLAWPMTCLTRRKLAFEIVIDRGAGAVGHCILVKKRSRPNNKRLLFDNVRNRVPRGNSSIKSQEHIKACSVAVNLSCHEVTKHRT